MSGTTTADTQQSQVPSSALSQVCFISVLALASFSVIYGMYQLMLATNLGYRPIEQHHTIHYF